ncbi:hypothetical protein ACQP2F_12420 [Actinoplanes sp. CA-030573]|uniref:hypothetical protein n=1 Tax=Actinoplanes sp. CA-030573 TaxID=3239898 RepID=UPI003D93AE4C
MMTVEDVAAIMQGLDGVRESRRGGLRRWDRSGRLVARQLDAEQIVVRSGFEERERLLTDHPGTFFVPPRFDAHMMVVARLTEADSAAVAAAVNAAWQLQRRDDR